MTFDEKVEICEQPLKKVCNETIAGEKVCRTEYYYKDLFTHKYINTYINGVV